MSNLAEDLDTLAALGDYESSDAVLEDAVHALLRRRPELRTALAIEKYRNDEVSVNRAAELAGISSEAFKEELANRGVTRSAGFLSDEERQEKLNDVSN